jgi:DNA-binding NtrC family response regulator
LGPTLFGDEARTFNGDKHYGGACEAADGGTLFLDEVTELGLQIQPKLLSVLDADTLHGSNQTSLRQTQVRIIAATNEEPGVILANGLLREDLFYRLHVVPIFVPPLRERPEDIAALAALFARRCAPRHGRAVRGFSDEAIQTLQRYDWPGNVQQLENVVERLVVLARGERIEAEQVAADGFVALPEATRHTASNGVAKPQNGAGDVLAGLTPIERHERTAIVEALRRADGHVIDAAHLLGLGHATMYRKIKQYSIPHERKRRANRPR